MTRSETLSTGCAKDEAATKKDSAATQRQAREETFVMGMDLR
jgi:hypothetical protein